jgi:hypothetical protein
VILDQELPQAYDAKCQLLDDTYDLMLETGYYVQPWALEKGALENPDAHPSPGSAGQCSTMGCAFDS